MGVTMARGRHPLGTTTDTAAMADTAAMVDMADTGVVMDMAKEKQSQAITVVVIMDTVATEAMEDTVDMADMADMVDMVMASVKLRPAITTATRVTVVDMEEATDMAMDIMVRPALIQEFSA